MSKRKKSSKKKLKHSLNHIIQKVFTSHPETSLTHKQVCSLIDVREGALRKLTYSVLEDLVRDRENQPSVLKSLSIVDPSLIATLASEAPVALKWLKEFGVKFDFLPLYFLSYQETQGLPLILPLFMFSNKLISISSKII